MSVQNFIGINSVLESRYFAIRKSITFMSKRQIVLLILGVLFLVFSFIIAKSLIDGKAPPPRMEQTQAKKLVKTSITQNGNINPETELLMMMESRDRIELFTEVNGRLLSTGKEFREGTAYAAGESILRLDDEEQRMNLLAQKTGFLNTLTSVLPDIKLDFPNSYSRWENYVLDFDEKKSISELPEAANKQEKFFLSSRNIPNQFYSIKSAEARLDKYSVRAPFAGKVILSSVNPGALVRTGQKIGEYVGAGNFEAEGGISADKLDFVSLGDSVRFTSNEGSGMWKGKVQRIAETIDASTQTVKIYCSVNGSGLKDGMYLNAVVYSEAVDDCIRIPRDLIIGDSAVFAVQDSKLKLIPVEVVRKGVKSALLKGVPNDTVLLSEALNNAYDGMPVTPQQ